MGRLFLIFTLFFFTNLSAQNYLNLDHSGFKKARIKFSKGFTYTGKAYIQHDNIFLPDAAYHKKFELNKVQSIEIPKGNFLIEGLLVGAATGTVVYLVAKYAHKEEEKTYGKVPIYDNSGNLTYQSTTHVEQNPFPGFAFIGILGGFTFLGLIIGKNTSKRSTIYTKESGSFNSRVNIIPTPDPKKGLIVSFKYCM